MIDDVVAGEALVKLWGCARRIGETSCMFPVGAGAGRACSPWPTSCPAAEAARGRRTDRAPAAQGSRATCGGIRACCIGGWCMGGCCIGGACGGGCASVGAKGRLGQTQGCRAAPAAGARPEACVARQASARPGQRWASARGRGRRGQRGGAWIGGAPAANAAQRCTSVSDCATGRAPGVTGMIRGAAWSCAGAPRTWFNDIGVGRELVVSLELMKRAQACAMGSGELHEVLRHRWIGLQRVEPFREAFARRFH